jgi:NTP pyrophosphatase (non-canonical NTP hydrolase)
MSNNREPFVTDEQIRQYRGEPGSLVAAEVRTIYEEELTRKDAEIEALRNPWISTIKAIITKWGRDTQVNKIQEEALELALVLNQRNCPTKDPAKMEEALYDELADMKIMMMQADILFDAERINERVAYKFDRVTKKHLTPQP